MPVVEIGKDERDKLIERIEQGQVLQVFIEPNGPFIFLQTVLTIF